MLVRIIWRGSDRWGAPTSFESVGWMVDRYRRSDGENPPFVLIGATRARDGEITDRRRIAKMDVVSISQVEPIVSTS